MRPGKYPPLVTPVIGLQGCLGPWLRFCKRERGRVRGSLELLVEASRERGGLILSVNGPRDPGGQEAARPRGSRKSSYRNRGGPGAGSPPPLSKELTQSLQSPKRLLHSLLSIQTRSSFQYGLQGVTRSVLAQESHSSRIPLVWPCDHPEGPGPFPGAEGSGTILSKHSFHLHTFFCQCPLPYIVLFVLRECERRGTESVCRLY